MKSSSRWAAVDPVNGVAVGKSSAVDGVVVTPVCELGETPHVVVESTTPDRTLTADGVMRLIGVLAEAATIDAPDWGDRR